MLLMRDAQAARFLLQVLLPDIDGLSRSLALMTCLILLRAREVLTKASQSLLGTWPACVMISTMSPFLQRARSGTMRPLTLAPTQVLPTSEWMA